MLSPVASIVEVNPWAWQPCAGIDNEGKLDDDRAMPVPVGSPDPTADRHQEIRRNYAAEIENIDTRIGEIIDTVARRGELDNTVVIYSADHGEMLGDHDRWTKMVPYEAASASRWQWPAPASPQTAGRIRWCRWKTSRRQFSTTRECNRRRV
jgi:hypothetical protein